MLVNTCPGFTQLSLASTPMTYLSYCPAASKAPNPESPAAATMTTATFRLGALGGHQPRVAVGGEGVVVTLGDLRRRQLLALARMVPGRLGDADVVLVDADLRVGRARALGVAGREAVDERDVHAADEAEHA